MTINCSGTLIALSQPKIMGILNLTPDSFFDGGQFNNRDRALKQAEKMIEEGATFIDVGAASSKPGTAIISVNEEKKRLLPTFEALRKEFPEMLFSIDTYNSKTAASCLERGAVIINDISAGAIDSKMMVTVAQYKAVYIAMHMQGTPETMQNKPTYKNITKEVLFYFSKRKQEAFNAGINDVIIDPGFGFGKTIEHNYEILKNLHHFKTLECPLIVGLSRKSMLYKTLKTIPENALNGTSILNTISLSKGAHILRVHDVKEAKECITLLSMLQ